MISTHVLDLASGRPAAGVRVRIYRADPTAGWQRVAEAETDGDGRITELLPFHLELSTGDWRLRFDVGSWFEARGLETFYPAVDIYFTVKNVDEHHHVPLLLSPFGYSTYRGS